MKLKEILAISGQPGLFKYIAQSKNGIIVESLADGKRTNAPSTAKVSSLGEIAIYTDTEDLALGKIFEAISAKESGKQTISHKSTPDQLKAMFAEVVPDYDRDRVHVSDMKKMVSWYNTLTAAGMTDFSVEEEEQDESEESTENKEDKKE